MGSKYSFQCLLLITLQIIHSASSFKCYVCAPDEGKPEDMYTLRKSFPSHHILPCSQYTKHNKHKYLLQCPHGGTNGCLTKFEANGSVMRTCAPIAIEDCKEANGINYCYCKKEGCNTPERKLSDPENNDTFSSLGDSQAAARVSSSYPSYTRVAVSDKSFTRYFDDEDLDEGSGDWGDFYYDDYNYIDKGDYYGGAYDDSEYGDGGRDDEDMTEPPPFLDLEKPVEDTGVSHKYDRNRHKDRTKPGHDNTDINFVEDDKDAVDHHHKPGSAAGTFSSSLHLMILILLSEVLVRI